jgi:hypothetical protein
MTTTISPMLRLFREGAKTYQPEHLGGGLAVELAIESGDPQVSLENMRRLMATGLVVRDILVGKGGVLVLFREGEQFYATGFRVGTQNAATEALAQMAAEARFGPYDELLQHYRSMPASYTGQLLPLLPD